MYILKCSDGSLYTGQTDNVEKRLVQHHIGYFTSCYTFSRRPLELLWSQGFESRTAAFVAEQKIKKWSHLKKYALAKGYYTTLSWLARSKK